MEIKLKRTVLEDSTTLGEVYINDVFYAFSLEDAYRDGFKIPGQTCIPYGRYEIKPRNVGGMTKRYAAKFPWHKGMLWLQDVQNFKWVYIHIGNTIAHTDGCILVGEGVKHDHVTGDFTLISSTNAYKHIALLCYECFDAGEPVHITIE